MSFTLIQFKAKLILTLIGRMNIYLAKEREQSKTRAPDLATTHDESKIKCFWLFISELNQKLNFLALTAGLT